MTFTDVLIGIGAMINHYRDKKCSDIVKALTLMHEEALNDVSDYAHDHVIAGIEAMLTAVEQKQRKSSDSQQLLCLKERIMARLDRGCHSWPRCSRRCAIVGQGVVEGAP